MTTLQSAQPARIWKRVVAGVIDFVIMGMVVWPPLCLGGFGDVDREIEFMRGPLGWNYPLVPFLALWLFPFCLRDLVAGRSLGKWLLGVRVVDAGDLTVTPGAGRLILRNLTIWFAPVGLFVARKHPDRMRFGDRLARTMVVEDAPSRTASSWGQTLFRGGVFALAAVGSLWFARTTMERYYRGSRAWAAAVQFYDGCTTLRDLAPEVRGDALTLLRYFPTDNGAIAQLTCQRSDRRGKCSALVLMERTRNRSRTSDDVKGPGPISCAAWRGVVAQVVFDPGMTPDNLTRSVLNVKALEALKGYEPLHRAVRNLDPAQTRLIAAEVLRQGRTDKAVVIYQRKPDKWAASFAVALRRADDAWDVTEAQGIVSLNTDNALARCTFVFVRSRDVHRYLTPEEVGRLERGAPLSDVVPEFRPSPDNVPAAR